MIELLIGVVGGVLIFSALLWSIYRVVVTNGYARISALGAAIATLLAMAGASYGISWVVMIAAMACVVFGAAQTVTDPRWSKLLPLVQVALGIILLFPLV